MYGYCHNNEGLNNASLQNSIRVLTKLLGSGSSVRRTITGRGDKY